MTQNRRPIQSRNIKAIQSLAAWMAQKNIQPNAISFSSMVFAAAAFGFMYASQITPWLALPAALLIQCRLMANLLDGLVAVEGNRKSPTGGFWNEFPDRPADVLILTGLGLMALSPTLGLLAALGALASAYTRTLGAQLTQQENFSGPMAKQHRMFLATLACVIYPFIAPAAQAPLLEIILWIIIAGTVYTTAKRAHTLVRALKHSTDL